MTRTRPRFPGLDSLRFWAALLVIIDHVPITQSSWGLPHPTFGAVSFRGAPAVSFFFTLSGFLITFLLLDEQRRRGDVDVKAFYARRALRIWPLYAGVTMLGIFFYKVALPVLGIHYATAWPAWLAALLYAAFLPALFNSLYAVGGLLNPLWSIGVEEQFYLSWAPTVRRSRECLASRCVAVLAVFLALSIANQLDWFDAGRLKKFVGQLEFHFMAVGALAAWLLHERREALLGWACFRRRTVQASLWTLLAAYVLVGPPPGGALAEELLQLLVYSWLIVETAANPERLVPVGARITDWLGQISYGLYLLHMFAIYGVTYLFARTRLLVEQPAAYAAAYYLLVLATAMALAAASQRWLEAPVLALAARFRR